MKPILILAIAGLAVAGPAARADSVSPELDEGAAITQAESVVAGAFTGTTARQVREQRNATDAAGRVVTRRIELDVHEFAVAEQLDGAALPAQISINVPGAVQLPAPGRRVVIGVRSDGATPGEGYNLLYGRALAADGDDRLAELRTWVLRVRAPAPVAPQAIADRLGQLAGEVAGDKPAPGGPPGRDDPNGARPIVLAGPPRSVPRVIEPGGDPGHPPERAALPAGAAGPAPPHPPNAPPTAPPPGTTAATAPSPAPAPLPRPRRWPYLVLAASLVAVLSVWWHRR
jgi:hypothetical protein